VASLAQGGEVRVIIVRFVVVDMGHSQDDSDNVRSVFFAHFSVALIIALRKALVRGSVLIRDVVDAVDASTPFALSARPFITDAQTNRLPLRVILSVVYWHARSLLAQHFGHATAEGCPSRLFRRIHRGGLSFSPSGHTPLPEQYTHKGSGFDLSTGIFFDIHLRSGCAKARALVLLVGAHGHLAGFMLRSL
jgi:hypothetical protein